MTSNREMILEALSWWEDDDGRWGHEKAERVLDAFVAETFAKAHDWTFGIPTGMRTREFWDLL